MKEEGYKKAEFPEVFAEATELIIGYNLFKPSVNVSTLKLIRNFTLRPEKLQIISFSVIISIVLYLCASACVFHSVPCV